MRDPIYLDYNATTPVAAEVLEAMLPWLRDRFGNSSSAHRYGHLAAQAIATAREQVAAPIGAASQEIVFTGCATESNNLAVIGVARALAPARRHLVISAVEHPAVKAPAMMLRAQGWDVTVVPVDGFGRISLDVLERSLRQETALVSVIHANNEVGTVQPLREIGRMTGERGILLHTDAAQSAGKLRLDVDETGVDLLTLAGHKFQAPKGVGALYVRGGTRVVPVLHGADQEHGLRPGTANVTFIVGLGMAALLGRNALPSIAQHMLGMRDLLHERLAAAVPGLQLNGHPEQRFPNTLNVSFPGVSGRTLLDTAADVVAASVGSACHSQHDAVSGVLAAMGADSARAAGAVRLSVGRSTTRDEVELAAEALTNALLQIRRR